MKINFSFLILNCKSMSIWLKKQHTFFTNETVNKASFVNIFHWEIHFTHICTFTMYIHYVLSNWSGCWKLFYCKKIMKILSLNLHQWKNRKWQNRLIKILSQSPTGCSAVIYICKYIFPHIFLLFNVSARLHTKH